MTGHKISVDKHRRPYKINKQNKKSFYFLRLPNGSSKRQGDIAIGFVSHTPPTRRRISHELPGGEELRGGKQFTPPVLSYLRECRRVWLVERWFGALPLWDIEWQRLLCNSFRTNRHAVFICIPHRHSLQACAESTAAKFSWNFYIRWFTKF